MTDIYHSLMQSVKFSLIKRSKWRQAIKQTHSITQKLTNFQKQCHSELLFLPCWSIQSECQSWVYIDAFAILWVNVPFITSTENFCGWICTLQVKIDFNLRTINHWYSSIGNTLYFFWLASKLEWAMTTFIQPTGIIP